MLTLLIGVVLMVAAGLPAAIFFDNCAPFAAFTGLCIFAGFVMVANFGHYIFFNPRWGR